MKHLGKIAKAIWATAGSSLGYVAINSVIINVDGGTVLQVPLDSTTAEAVALGLGVGGLVWRMPNKAE